MVTTTLTTSENAAPDEYLPNNTGDNTDDYIVLEDNSGYRVYAFFQYALTGINISDISSAKLYIFSGGGDPDDIATVKRALGTISTSTTCWNNMPGVTSTNSVNFVRPSVDSYVECDVSSMIKDLSSNILCIRVEETSGSCGVYTKYYNSSRASKLVITYDDPTEYNNIYVDPVNGSDANAGTQTYPLASLSLAASRVNANGTVHIKAGSVWAPSAGQIGPTNKPVTYYIY